MRLVGEDNSDGKHVGVRQKRGHSGREARLGRSWNGLAVQTFRRLDPNEPCFEIIADLIWAFKKCMTAPWAYSATQRLLMTRDGVAKKKKRKCIYKGQGNPSSTVYPFRRWYFPIMFSYSQTILNTVNTNVHKKKHTKNETIYQFCSNCV